MLKCLLITVSILISQLVFAEKIEKYKGIAYNKKNEIVYIENHTATFNKNGRIIKAKTVYTNTKGVKIGEIDTDFSKSISAPIYVYKDLRFKTGHGIRYKNDKLILIKFLKNGSEETKVFDGNKDNKKLVVGGQGLHYYLTTNFNSVKSKKNIPINFLTPGNLGYYNFKLNYLGKNKDNLLEFEVIISNFILRFFAPKLTILYNPTTKKLVRYEGLSNISDQNNKTQAVTIKYQY